MAVKIGRPLYRRCEKYVAVRAIRVSADDTIQPGEDVNLRQHHMRSLYNRRRIGIKGHPWTEQALESRGFPKNYATEETEDDVPAPVKVEFNKDGLTEDSVRKTEDGKKWEIEGVEDEVFKTKKAAIKRLKELAEEVLNDDTAFGGEEAAEAVAEFAKAISEGEGSEEDESEDNADSSAEGEDDSWLDGEDE